MVPASILNIAIVILNYCWYYIIKEKQDEMMLDNILPISFWAGRLFFDVNQHDDLLLLTCYVLHKHPSKAFSFYYIFHCHPKHNQNGILD